MFEAKIVKGVVLKNVMFAIKDVHQSIRWFCTPEGVTICGMDVSLCSILRLRLNKELFEDYRCDRDLSFAMNTSSLAKVVKYVSNEEMITLAFGQRGDKLDVFIEKRSETDWSQYIIKLIDYDIGELDLSEDENSATIRMPSAKLQRICNDLSQISKRITIASAPTQARFYASGEIGTGCLHLYPTFYVDEPHMEVTFDVKQAISQTFNLKILNQLTKATLLSSQVVINMRADKPLELIYEIKASKIGSNCGVKVLTSASLRLYLTPDVEIED